MAGSNCNFCFGCRFFGNETLGSLAVSSPHPYLVRRFFLYFVAYPAAHIRLALGKYISLHQLRQLDYDSFRLDFGLSSP